MTTLARFSTLRELDDELDYARYSRNGAILALAFISVCALITALLAVDLWIRVAVLLIDVLGVAFVGRVAFERAYDVRYLREMRDERERTIYAHPYLHDE